MAIAAYERTLISDESPYDHYIAGNGTLTAQQNAGMLVFAEGRERPDYVPWSEVERIDLDRP